MNTDQFRTTYTDAFFVINASDHFDTHLGNLWKVWLFYADVTENLYDSFPYADASVLYNQYKTVVTDPMASLLHRLT